MNNSLTLQSCQEYIKNIDNSNIISTKWKCSQNQAVFQTQNYFYKIYKNSYMEDFFIYIRQQLGKIYRQKYNIQWQIVLIKTPDSIFQIQKREKLKIASKDIISMQQLIKNWGNILKQLQKRLKLDLICKQLRQYQNFKDISQLLLIRDCANNYNDYAILQNGQIILLDDTSFFIAMINEKGQWLYKHNQMIQCLTKYGNRVFTMNKYVNDINHDIRHLNDKINKWNLYNFDYYNKKINKATLVNMRDKIIQNNIKILNNIKNIEYK